MKPILLALVFALAQSAAATTLQDLKNRDQLRLRSWIEPSENISVGQEVKLVVEVATRRWFAGGTRIRHPEVPNLVVLQRDGFATNLSRQEEGQTWVVQQWHLEFYPQIESRFEIPALKLELAVNDAQAGIVRGELQTEPQSFVASVPVLMREVSNWLAAPAFSVEQRFDRELTELAPGDAFTRTITLRATQLTAMMLPAIDAENIAGLTAYPANPTLESRSNRGEATAIRTQTITYVVEQSGQYQLPALNFHWWDTQAGAAKLASLDSVTIDAGESAASAAEPQAKAAETPLKWLPLLAVLPLIALLWWIRGRPGQVDRLKLAQALLRRGRIEDALREIYGWLNREKPKPDWLSLRSVAKAADPATETAIEALLDSAYSGKDTNATTALATGALRSRERGLRLRSLLRPVEITLNPGSSAASRKASR